MVSVHMKIDLLAGALSVQGRAVKWTLILWQANLKKSPQSVILGPVFQEFVNEEALCQKAACHSLVL